MQQEDADLAQAVLNVRHELEAAEARLEELQSEARRRQAAAQELQAQVQADLEAQQAVLADVRTSLADAEGDEKQAKKAYEEWQAELAATGYGGHGSVALPGAWQGVFKVCPVDQPRGSATGSVLPGTWGYHLHKGVDIVAPLGTPIRATFDGVASDATNIYGGKAVYGKDGTGRRTTRA